VFKECIEQLPFSKDAKVVSFEYYDFKYQDAILQNDPFPDVYIVQLDVGISFAAVKQYLKENCFNGKRIARFMWNNQQMNHRLPIYNSTTKIVALVQKYHY
jgi:hypothetical protein